MPNDSPVRKWIITVLQYLKKLKPGIGEFESNYSVLKKFLLERLMACEKDLKEDNIYPELILNYIKLAALFRSLEVFKLPEKEKKKLDEMGRLSSKTDRHKSQGHKKKIRNFKKKSRKFKI